MSDDRKKDGSYDGKVKVLGYTVHSEEERKRVEDSMPRVNGFRPVPPLPTELASEVATVMRVDIGGGQMIIATSVDLSPLGMVKVASRLIGIAIDITKGNMEMVEQDQALQQDEKESAASTPEMSVTDRAFHDAIAEQAEGSEIFRHFNQMVDEHRKKYHNEGGGN